MYKNIVRVISIVLVLSLGNGIANAGGFRQEPGPDGIVSIEAENYDNNIAQGGHQWIEVGETDGFTGNAGMQAQPNIRVNNTTDYVTKSPRLDYKINFVKTGTHYIWLRVWANDGSDDSCHAGLDFQALDTCDAIDGFDNTYIWTNSTIDEVPPTFEVTTTGLHTFNIWMREDGCIVDKIVLTTNENYEPTDNGPAESIREPDLLAYNPVPSDGASDITRDVVLSWTPGDFAQTHDVYLGDVFEDVNSADTSSPLLLSPSHDANTYAPGRLEFDTTYYWRIDEVNDPAVPMTYKGFIWRFATERFAYPIPGEKIIATSSGQEGNQDPQNTVNNSGLTNDLHSTDPADMWLSETVNPAWPGFNMISTKLTSCMKCWYGIIMVRLSFPDLGLRMQLSSIRVTAPIGHNWEMSKNLPGQPGMMIIRTIQPYLLIAFLYSMLRSQLIAVGVASNLIIMV